MATIVPRFKWITPTITHEKLVPYVDYPIVYNETVTNRVFYVEYDFTFATSDATNTTLSKWNGNGWSAISSMDNPEYVWGRGFFAVTTAANAYVTVTEHTR